MTFGSTDNNTATKVSVTSGSIGSTAAWQERLMLCSADSIIASRVRVALRLLPGKEDLTLGSADSITASKVRITSSSTNSTAACQGRLTLGSAHSIIASKVRITSGSTVNTAAWQ